ncbi:MAG: HEAT repeat domain-containing protein, partial [Bacteroidota bacterium]
FFSYGSFLSAQFRGHYTLKEEFEGTKVKKTRKEIWLEENNDEDAWLRHAGVIALGRIGEEAPLTALASNPSVALRTAAVVALRRMKSPSVAAFLSDEEEFVATEAARAINDDYSIEAALPALANALTNSRFSSEPFVRRAINANVRVGTAENIDVLMAYVKDTIAPPAMRAEALISLGTWGTPSVFDRVDGRYRGPIQRDSTPVIEALRPVLAALLTDEKERIQIATAGVASRLQVKDLAGPLYELFQANPSPEVKVAALEALQILEAASLETALEAAFNDRSDKVRSAALSLLPASKITPTKAIELFRKVMRNGTTNEKQATLAALGEVQSEAAVEILGQSLQDLQSGRATPDIQLDIIEAIEAQNNSDLVAQLADYQANKPEDDPLAMFSETLAGGDAGRGYGIFYWNEAAQCVRCHAIFEYGGNAGPGLSGIASRLSPEELLESLIAPSAKYAAGYEVVLLETANGETLAGILKEETDTQLKIQIGKDQLQSVDKGQINSRESVPSAMPSVSDKLSKMEIRDLVAFLRTLEEEAS